MEQFIATSHSILSNSSTWRDFFNHTRLHSIELTLLGTIGRTWLSPTTPFYKRTDYLIFISNLNACSLGRQKLTQIHKANIHIESGTQRAEAVTKHRPNQSDGVEAAWSRFGGRTWAVGHDTWAMISTRSGWRERGLTDVESGVLWPGIVINKGCTKRCDGSLSNTTQHIPQENYYPHAGAILADIITAWP